AEYPALGRGADLDHAATRSAFDLDLVEIVLRLLQLQLRVLRHLHDRIEIGHFGHVRSLWLKRFRVRNPGTRPSPRGRWDRQARRSERAPRRFSPDRAATARRRHPIETPASSPRSRP